MNTPKNNLHHKLLRLIAKMLNIEAPKNIFQHNLKELELSLFERDERHVRVHF